MAQSATSVTKYNGLLSGLSKIRAETYRYNYTCQHENPFVHLGTVDLHICGNITLLCKKTDDMRCAYVPPGLKDQTLAKVMLDQATKMWPGCTLDDLEITSTMNETTKGVHRVDFNITKNDD